MLIPYGIQTYKRSDLPQIELTNVYAEQVPSNPNKLALLPRPALMDYAVVGSGKTRGMFYQPGAIEYPLFLQGNGLYSNGSMIGTIGGTSRVAMAGTTGVVLIANGTNLYSTNGNSLSTIIFPDGAGASSVVFLGGYAFAARTDTRRIYFTLDPSTWDGLDYISAEQSTGNIIGFALVGDQLWVFCERTTEIFILTGDPDTPIQSVQGRVFDKGCLSAPTIVQIDNSVMWVGHDNVVYRGDSVPTRVSDHGIEELIAESDPSEVGAWYLPWKGHSFYSLTTADRTTALDAATKQWTRLKTYNRDIWRANCGIIYDRMILAGDAYDGKIWQLRDGVFLDEDDAIERYFTVILNDQGFVDNIMVNISVGEVDSPAELGGLLEMRTSRDGGFTWGEWRQTSLGEQGQYRKRAGFRRVGFVDTGNLIAQFRVTDPRPSTISYIRLNDLQAGRGR